LARHSYSLLLAFLCLLCFSQVSLSRDSSSGITRDYEAEVRRIYHDDPDYEKKWPVEFHIRVAEGVLFDFTNALSRMGTPYYDEFALHDQRILLQGLERSVTRTSGGNNSYSEISIDRDLFTQPAELVWGRSGAEKVLPGEARSAVWTLESASSKDSVSLDMFWKKYVSAFRFFDRLTIKIKKGAVPQPGTFEGTAVVEFAGKEAGAYGYWRRDYGKLNLSFTKTEAGWRIHRFAILEMTTERRKTKMFENVTEKWIRNLPQRTQYLLTGYSIDDEVLVLSTSAKNAPRGALAGAYGRITVTDIDQDGWDDLLVWDEMTRVILLHNVELPSGERGFEESSRFGLDLQDVSSVVSADLNNDGVLDVVVGRLTAPSEVLLGMRTSSHPADLIFLPSITNLKGILPARVSSIALADVNQDGFLDIFFATTGRNSSSEKDSERDPIFDRAGPPNTLLINLGGGEFADFTQRFGVGAERSTLAAAFVDYNGDDYPDLAIANDFGKLQLYLNEDGGHFSDVTREAGVDNIFFGMGLSWGDYDNDGDPDLYVAAMQSTAGQRITSNPQNISSGLASEKRMNLLLAPRGNILLRNNADGTFSDVTKDAPFSPVGNANWAYGAQFADFNNDSWLDIFSPNGFFTYPRRPTKVVVRDF
jgi:hypothetical protein